MIALLHQQTGNGGIITTIKLSLTMHQLHVHSIYIQESEALQELISCSDMLLQHIRVCMAAHQLKLCTA